MSLLPIARMALLTTLAVVPASMAWPQAQEPGQRVVLVLPFENRSGQANLDWVGESFATTFNQRLSSTGFLAISRADRDYALDHLGLPTGLRPSRATTIRIAQNLDAQFVLVGNYDVKGGQVIARAQVLEVNRLTLSPPLEQSAPLQQLVDVENGLAWQSAKQMDPGFAVAQTTFLSASSGLKLEAFESYIRGIASNNLDEKLKRLRTAVDLAPNNADALLALGRAEYAAGDYEGAATTLARVPQADPLALEAGFYRGLARFNNGQYADAEGAFAVVSSRLPLPEVVNNQGVAMARQHKNATVLLQRASAADPQEADYHYNTALSLRRAGDNVHAKSEIDQAVKLRPTDAEAKTLQAIIAGTQVPPPGFDPQERIRRTYSETAFRQAAFQLDQMRAARIASLPPAQQADEYAQAGQEYLTQGLVLEAEREFHAALAADPNSAAGHLGLAQVRERSGNPVDARKEAEASLSSKRSVAAYLTLSRIDLAANNTAGAATDVGNALRLEPNNPAALGMKSALANRGISIP